MDPERRKSKLTLEVRTFDSTLKSLDTDSLCIYKAQPFHGCQACSRKWGHSEEDRRES